MVVLHVFIGLINIQWVVYCMGQGPDCSRNEKPASLPASKRSQLLLFSKIVPA